MKRTFKMRYALTLVILLAWVAGCGGVNGPLGGVSGSVGFDGVPEIKIKGPSVFGLVCTWKPARLVMPYLTGVPCPAVAAGPAPEEG